MVGCEAVRMQSSAATYHPRGPATDEEINGLHQQAFKHTNDARWNKALSQHSITWITARLDGRLVGFVNVIGDGGEHAVLLDTAVWPRLQGRGIGRRLVAEAAGEAARVGCRWLHADYEPRLVGFYESACGLRRTNAGLLELPARV